MKIGDYVRTNKGIARIIGKNDDVIYTYPDAWETDTYLEIVDDTEYLYDGDIIKSNKNIIELLEPQDLMYIDIDNGWVGGIVVPRIAETLAELNEYIDSFKKKKLTLVGVVTREQLHSIAYKIGEGNE